MTFDHIVKGDPSWVAASPQLKADFTALQNDMKSLQSEVPATLTATLKADQQIIVKALTGKATVMPKLGHRGDHLSAAGSSLPANIVTRLENAGVSSSQATQIATDIQNYQTTLKSLDPALQSKITADKAAITKDGGPAMTHGPLGVMHPDRHS
jgi:hypothetical protein